MGNSWPPAAWIGRSDSGARTEPSPETSRIWTTGSFRLSSPPTPASCSIPGAGQMLPVSARRSCGSPRDRSGCDSPSMTILSCREPSLPTARWRPRRGAIPTKSTSGDCRTLHPYTAWPARVSQTCPPAGARTASGSPGATHSSTPRPNDRGPLERSFTLADLEFGPSPDASYRRARESRGSLSLQLTGPTSLEVKQQDAVVAKIAPPYPYETIRSFSFVTGDRVAVGGRLCTLPLRRPNRGKDPRISRPHRRGLGRRSLAGRAVPAVGLGRPDRADLGPRPRQTSALPLRRRR